MDQNPNGLPKFPKGFLFGSATSAFQTEGYNFNTDWHEWEKTGATTDHMTDHPAADSWHKWSEDIELLKQTHQNAYRFGVEWARIEPEEGKFDLEAVNHYRNILVELKKNKITPMVTLHHFTLPLWLAKKNGVLNSKFPYYFARYAEKVVSEIGALADLWTTINEPKVYILDGIIRGKFPPNQKNYWKAFWARKNLINAHILAYHSIKKINKKIQVGINQNLTTYEPVKNTFLNRILTRIVRFVDADIFITPTNKFTDFLGINYYRKYLIQAKKPFAAEAGSIKNEYGWNINQEGIYQLIKENIKWQKSIYITENGVPDEFDKIRAEFIGQALENIQKTINDGADIRGYFYWSLLDNFELSEGYIMKFGLADINRNLRPSAFVYKKLIDGYTNQES